MPSKDNSDVPENNPDVPENNPDVPKTVSFTPNPVQIKESKINSVSHSPVLAETSSRNEQEKIKTEETQTKNQSLFLLPLALL